VHEYSIANDNNNKVTVDKDNVNTPQFTFLKTYLLGRLAVVGRPRVLPLCYLFFCFTGSLISHSVDRKKYVRGWVLGSSWKSHSDLSPITPIILRGWKVRNLALNRFSTPAAFESVWFQNGVTYQSLKPSWSADDWPICSHQIWCSSVYSTVRIKGVQYCPRKWGGKWVESGNSAADCSILLKFGISWCIWTSYLKLNTVLANYYIFFSKLVA